jgi:hypothetical protein
LVGHGHQPDHRPALLLPATAMRRCLAPQLNLAVTPEKRGAWLANREALVDGVRLDQNFA